MLAQRKENSNIPAPCRSGKDPGARQKQEALFVGGTAARWMFTAALMSRLYVQCVLQLSTRDTPLGR